MTADGLKAQLCYLQSPAPSRLFSDLFTQKPGNAVTPCSVSSTPRRACWAAYAVREQVCGSDPELLPVSHDEQQLSEGSAVEGSLTFPLTAGWWLFPLQPCGISVWSDSVLQLKT